MANEVIGALVEEANIRKCVLAGKNEPDKSSIRSSWQAVGFYTQPKQPQNLVTTWRR